VSRPDDERYGEWPSDGFQRVREAELDERDSPPPWPPNGARPQAERRPPIDFPWAPAATGGDLETGADLDEYADDDEPEEPAAVSGSPWTQPPRADTSEYDDHADPTDQLDLADEDQADLLDPVEPPANRPGVYRPATAPPSRIPPQGHEQTREQTGEYEVPQAPLDVQDVLWRADPFVPTAEEFARRRAVRPPEPVATTGVRGAVRRSTLGVIRLAPSERERAANQAIECIRRNFGGLRQVTVVNPKGGAGKTVAVVLLGMTFGQKRGGYVLAWDNNETQGTLGMRAQQDFHSRTVRDLLRNLDHFAGSSGRIGDLSQYVRSQGEGMFDVLASDESATAGEMLTAEAFADIRDVVSRFYKLIVVDTGNNVRAANWQAAIDATDQLVVTMSARNDSAETAARMLDHLEQTGRHRLVRQAVTVVSMPPSRKDIDLPAIERHFAARTRGVLLAPYERLIDSGEPIRYGLLTSASREAWLQVAAMVAEGL
jgi:MinD-like ATPase involved in chromosome partitioning or flagellar assembly